MKKRELSNTRFAAIAALVALTTIATFFSIFAIWSKQQALDTDTWTSKSGELLEQKAVRDAVAHYVVEQVDRYVDLDRQLKENLPDSVAPFAGPLSERILKTAERTVSEALRTKAAISLWEIANRKAHEEFVKVIKNDDSTISTKNGEVVLKLGALIDLVVDRLDLEKKDKEAIPKDAGRIVLFHASELERAQIWARSLERFAVILPLLALLFAGLALLLARDRRRLTLTSLGIGLAIAGGTTLFVQDSLRTNVVDQATKSNLDRSAAVATWDVGTSLLVEIAKGVLIAGAALTAIAVLFVILGRFSSRPT